MSKQDQVDAVLGQIEGMAKFWPIIDALKGGTDAMRKAAEKYLPKRNMEAQSDYKQRLETATLYPAFADTVDSMVGRVFTKPIKIDESLPADIMGLLSDVDTEDRNLHTFARDWMDDAVSYGISHVLVDMPKNEAKTKADEKALCGSYWFYSEPALCYWLSSRLQIPVVIFALTCPAWQKQL